MTTDAQADLRRGDSIKIVFLKDNAVKKGKTSRWEMFAHHKNSQAKFLHITQTEDKKTNDAYMK